jgi:hypothetical protein
MAILATERVLTLDWWKPASKIEVGDYVFDKDGKIVRVKLIQQYHSDSCYEVTFSDYLTVRGDNKLGFPTEDLKYRKRLDEYKGVFKFTRPLRHYTTEDFLSVPLRDKRERFSYSVPTTQPLKLPHQTLPVPPFVFGFWFFNRKAHQKFNAPTKRHEEVAARLKDYGYKIKLGSKRPAQRREFTVTPTIESQLVPNIPTKITNNYLMADVEQRIDLLSGIVLAKSAQYNPQTNKFRITARDFPTISRIQMLVESLGSRTAIEHSEPKGNYTIYFKTHHKLLSDQTSPEVKVHHGRRYITKITKIPAQVCVHIETTASDNTILVGEGFIPCR